MRNFFASGALGLVLLVVSMTAANPPAATGYGKYDAVRGKARGLAKSEFVSYTALARTLGGRDVALLTIGTGRTGEKPAILVVAGTSPARLVDTEVTLRVAERLVQATAADADTRELLDRLTLYIIAQASPDGAEAFFERPLRQREANARPIDDDTDGLVDEDGPDDLNGDGLVTVMRVEDAAGEYIVHPDDDRVMIEADAEKGQRGRYRLYAEGRDDDGDGQLNEDPPGGVAFDRNFPFKYAYFSRGAGPHQVSEIETRAVADFAFDHPNIVMVWTLSDRDNLLDEWKPDKSAEKERIKTTLLGDDAPYFDKIAKAYEEIHGKVELPEARDAQGSMVEWAYFHYGRWSVATRPWAIPETEAEESPDDESAEKDAEQDDAAEEGDKKEGDKKEKEKRGADDLKALAWFKQRGEEGFVDWRPFDHPDLPDKKVEIGGFKPFVRENPPFELLDELAGKQYEFLRTLAGVLPRIEIADVKTEPLGSGVWRVTATVKNSGVLPTMSEMGRLTGDPQRLQVELKLPAEVSLLTGHLRRTIRPLPGDGGAAEETWLVRAAATGRPKLRIRAYSPMTGSVTQQVMLGAEAK